MNPVLQNHLQVVAGARSRDDLVCVIADDLLGDVLRLMGERHIGAVIVVDERSQTAGIFTERDLLMKAADLHSLRPDTTVGELMTRNPVCVLAATTVAEAADLMIDCGFRHLIINDRNGCPDGIVSIRDLLRVLRRADHSETVP